jgi:nicotinamidase-related amidase
MWRIEMSDNWAHLCIDMQRVFAEETPWHVPWMRKVSPHIEELAKRHCDRTIFTRFMTPSWPEEVRGMWRPYYEKWWMMTRERLDPALLDLVPSLRALVPPAL